MYFFQFVFFLSVGIVFYNYAGYAILTYLMKLVAGSPGRKLGRSTDLPSVSFIVAAYNEEQFIEKKIINSLSQNYPASSIEFIFITDGSSDGTNAVLERYPSITLLHQPERRGKSAAINRAVSLASNEILIFSDANTTLNEDATLHIARHYLDERVGGVAGEKKVASLTGTGDEVGAGEGIYWKYESLLKKIDSGFYSVVGAAGELFSLRRSLYERIPDHVILDDFILSLRAALKGYRIIYEPAAYATESPSFSIKDERKRKVRIAAGGFQSIGMLKGLLLFWKYPRLSFLYISHRVLRWTLSPLCLILAFVSNGVLYFSQEPVFKVSFLCQCLFYGMSGIAAVVPPDKCPKLFKIPYYFTFMNISVIMGFFRFLSGKQSAIWEKAKRSPSAIVIKE
ncbi:MAG: glycosyltransferase family 2 protein [Chitinophagaceae bacterium]|nr:glycosyltransferase family 2 protein [Chitinophagaceae bacterium]